MKRFTGSIVRDKVRVNRVVGPLKEHRIAQPPEPSPGGEPLFGEEKRTGGIGAT